MPTKKKLIDIAIETKRNKGDFNEFRERVEAEKQNRVYTPKPRRNLLNLAHESMNFDEFCRKAEE